MHKKSILKAAVAFAVALAFILPGSSAFANFEETMKMNISSSDVDISNNMKDLQTLDDDSNIIGTETIDWWPMFQHDLGNTGYSTSDVPDICNLLWNKSFMGDGYVESSPAIVDGKVYFGSQDDNFYCLDVTDGSYIWSYDAGGDGMQSNPAVADGRVYFGSDISSETLNSYLYCLDASDGSFIWEYDIGIYNIVQGSPSVVDDKVFFVSYDDNRTSRDHILICLNAYDGSFIWSCDRYVRNSDPAIADGKIFCTGRTIEGGYVGVVCLDASDGSEIWNYTSLGIMIRGIPAVADGKVFVGSEDDNLYCLNATDGSEIWSYTTDEEWSITRPSIAYDKVFYMKYDDDFDWRVGCLNIIDGSEIWNYNGKVNTFLTTLLSIANGKIFFGSSDFNIYCLDAYDGSFIWSYYTSGSISTGLAIADGKICVGAKGDQFYCFGFFQGHDVGIENIDSPITGPFDVFTPEISVKNVGIYNEANVPVSLQIARVGDGVVEYNKTVTIADIDAGETQVVTFSDWTPEDIGMSGSVRYMVTVCTQLANDDNPANDCVTKMIAVYHDDIDWWPMFHHDLNNSRYSTSTAPYTNNVLWQFRAESTINLNPAVADGKVFFGSMDNNVYCLDAYDGSFIWKYTTGANIYSSPAVADGKVYIGSEDRNLYCLDAQNGSFIWSYNTGSSVQSSPSVADGKVYFGSCDTNIYCLDAQNGSLIWSYTIPGTEGSIHSSAAVVDNKVFFGSNDNNIYCLNAQNGSLFWNYTTGGDVESSPAVVDDKVYFGSCDTNIYCLNAQNGSLIWNNSYGGEVASSPAVAYGKVFIGSYDKNLYCLDAQNGSLIWEYSTVGAVRFGSPSVADGKVFFMSGESIYCLNESDGSLIWMCETPGYSSRMSPAIAEGRLYAGGSRLYCFGPNDHDVGATSIVSPVSGNATVFTPEVTVKNWGIFNETNVPVNMQIDKIIYGDSWMEAVYGGEGRWEQAPLQYIQGGTGLYMAQASHMAHPGDIFDTGLFTTPQNLSGLTSVTLEFETSFYTAGTDWAEVNTYSGGNLEENLVTYTTNTYPGIHETLTFNPEGYTDPSEVYIEFYYTTGGVSGGYFFHIDNVSIASTGFSEGFEGPTFPPIEIVFVPEYNENATTNINTGETEDAIFPDWTPNDLGTYYGSIDYRITTSTQLLTDEDSINNGKTEWITLDFVVEYPSVDINKWVWDGSEWVDMISAEVCNIVRFRIDVHNDGDYDLFDIIVNDTLPICLEYAGNAVVDGTPREPDYISPDGKRLTWQFPDPFVLHHCEHIIIEFDVHVISEGVNINEVCADADSIEGPVFDCDTATVVAGVDIILPEITDVLLTASTPLDTKAPYGWENVTCIVTDNVEVRDVKLIVTYPGTLLGTTEYIMINIPGTDTYYCNTTFTDAGFYDYIVWADDTSSNANQSASETFALPANWEMNNDGVCDICDLVKTTLHFAETGPRGWIREDYNNDGVCDISDLVKLTLHFGETWK